eukprot:1773683-Prymnesium_polylepis.1
MRKSPCRPSLSFVVLVSVLAFQNSIIQDCRAIGGPGYQRATGGGMTIQQGAEVTFTNVTLSGCFAGEAAFADGGALYTAEQSRVLMTDSTIVSCHAIGVGQTSRARGAAVFAEGNSEYRGGSSIDFSATRIVGCVASSVLTAQGTIFLHHLDSTARFTNSVITDCRADAGGFLHVGDGSLAEITAVTATNTTAHSGAAVYMDTGSQLQLTHFTVHVACSNATCT